MNQLQKCKSLRETLGENRVIPKLTKHKLVGTTLKARNR